MAESQKKQTLDTEQNIYKTIVSNSGGSIYIVQNSKVVFCNDQFGELTGYSVEEIIGMEFSDLVHQKDKKLISLLFSSNYKEISQKKSRSYTFRALHKNGEMRWFKSNVSLITWKGEVALLDNCFDISQQKDFERKLVEEEQNFRLLVNGFEDMVFIISKRGVVVQANRSVYNRLVLSEHELILRNFSSFFSSDYRDEAKKVISDAFFGKRIIFSGELLTSKDLTIPIEARLFKGNWSQKEVVFAICQDISIRIEAQKIVKLSEEKFSKAFDNNAVMMVISSLKDGRFIDVNDIFLKTLGLKRTEVINKTSKELNIFNDIDRREQLKTVILKRKRVQDVETVILNRKKQEVICSFSAELMEIQGEQCLLYVISDITEKKKIQEKILQSEQRFRQLAELLPEKVFEADSNGYITFANNYLQSFLGYSNDQIYNKFHITKLFTKDSQGIITDYLNQSNINKELPSVELSVKKIDGTEFAALTSIIAIAESNQITRYMGVMVDISVRKAQELELVKAKDQAEEASRAKERFLSTMSHEIRTPMNAVIGMANILLQDKPMDFQMEHLQTLKLSAEGLMTLLNDILDFSKIEAGKLAVSKHPTNLKKLVKGVYNIYKHNAEKKGVSFKIDIEDNIPNTVMADSGRLNQILTNLTSNAIKFTSKGNVTLSIKIIKETKASVWVHFCVADSGIGIPADKQELIFQEFTQANTHTTRKYGGTGLGLAISKKLVSLLNGTLDVESQPGKGSQFFFTLCLRKAKQAAEPDQEAVMRPISLSKSGNPFKVLVVEDNEINSFIATKFLKDWGLETRVAENGSIAIDLIEKEYFDIILMDLEMPVMSGYEATEIIRKMNDPIKRNIPIVALTASAMLDVQTKIFNLGMNGFILKPFNPADLKAKISELIQLG